MSSAGSPRIKVMVSSTRTDLSQYRKEALRIIEEIAREKQEQLQIFNVSMEDTHATGTLDPIPAVSQQWVDDSDWVVLIVGFNYGTVWREHGVDGLSTTELEYRQLMHKAASAKPAPRLFLFVAGEPGTPDYGYRSRDEIKDLKDWQIVDGLQTAEGRDKVRQFRDRLVRNHHHSLFANLQMFVDKLAATLRGAVDDHLRSTVQPGTPLAELIVKVSPAIRDFTSKVARITHCKRVHDCLHDVRQEAIGRLQEEVLPRWQKDGTLTLKTVLLITARTNYLSMCMGTLKALLPGLPDPDHRRLRLCVDAVIANSRLVDDEDPELASDAGMFSEKLMDLSDPVEQAFSAADASMMSEVETLRERFKSLEKEVNATRQAKPLSSDDNARLNRDLLAVEELTDRLYRVLVTHNNWQNVHNHLQVLDSYRDTQRFASKLRTFCAGSLDSLLELATARLNATPDRDIAPMTPMTPMTPTALIAPGSPGSPVVSLAAAAPVLSGCESRLHVLSQLTLNLDALRSAADEDRYVEARKWFDAAFYCVDKQTLDEVVHISARAATVQQLVEELDRDRRERAEARVA